MKSILKSSIESLFEYLHEKAQISLEMVIRALFEYPNGQAEISFEMAIRALNCMK